MLCRPVFVKIPDDSSATDAVDLVREKYNNGEIILDADDFVCHSGEVVESYTELDEEFSGRVDYVI
jgi:hypothetical protein